MIESGRVGNYLWIVLKEFSFGSLHIFLKEETLSLSQSNDVPLSITQGIAFIHNAKPKFPQRDIKTVNVLICASGVKLKCVIADFELSICQNREILNVTRNKISDTIRYQSLEMLAQR